MWLVYGSFGDGVSEVGEARAVLAELADRLEDAREALAASSAAVERLEAVLAAAALHPARAALVGEAPIVGDGPGRYGLPDPLLDRVEELRSGCEALLRRPLRGHERPVVLEWAQLERDGASVPVPEILAVAGQALARPTADGTLPRNLRWCDETVRTLSRGPARAARWSGAAARSIEYAAMYERLADELDARERGA
jgi:hypothetical protein